MSVTSEEFRAALSRLAGGVVIVTARGEDGEPRGMTATAVCSVSLEPPLVMACLNRVAATHEAVLRSGVFALNVLPASAERLARRFAEPIPDKFAEIPVVEARTGAPILDRALAYCECRVVRSVRAGTHTIFIGEVEGAGVGDDPVAEPLVYYRGRYGAVAPLSDELEEGAP